MTGPSSDRAISKSNTGFPAYLDFEKLRSSAIAYLGQLSGKIWTDHNVHDPGITILEMLIYALLDLGYRTNLPPEDLFARDPTDTSKDNNFFTASRILANNPLTITDFRKLLVDLGGIKNAWLEVDDKTGVFDREIPGRTDQCGKEYLNGLYRVYVQLEEGIADNKHQVDQVLRKIRKALMTHRNLCEDFIDIRILCSLDLGLCADIELEEDADPGEVYIRMVTALRTYFSPAPRFYSLQKLLEKNTPIEDIFAGRPFNVTESHGFVDTEEFERLTLRKEIHLSDVYHVIFDIDGIKGVRDLGWIKCCGEKSTKDWKLILPENYVPEFSVKCSGFTFTRNGAALKGDLKEYETLVEMKFSDRQKAFYSEPSPFLDPEVPRGNYHSGLAEYYSIQNEFPRVYGISEGGLGGDVSGKRKAQALQLQGFLLFFDQLLANYLGQLKNIRSLFSLSTARREEDAHTYFIGQLTSVPQMQKLLRFNPDRQQAGSLGTEGSILAYPTARKILLDMIENNILKNVDPKLACSDTGVEFPPYCFCYAVERDQAVNQLRNDLEMGEYEPVIAANANDCYFFYLVTSSPDFAIVSRRYYKTEREAANAAASVKYTATFSENYRRFLEPGHTKNDPCFSFDIALNLDVYAKYLQLIVEDKDLYLKRRQDFQKHLLSRFAERFTDFALISSGFLPEKGLQSAQIKATDLFLRHYDDISSNRGKAYNYTKDKWESNNISGFERRFKALAGIEDWRKHYLCNFTVEKADKEYKLSIELFDTVFAVEDKILNQEQAMAALRSVFKRLANPDFQAGFVPHEKQWQLFILDEYGNKFAGTKLFRDKEEADANAKILESVSHFTPDFSSDFMVTQHVYKSYVSDHIGSMIAESREHFIESKAAEEYTRGIGSRLSFYLGDNETFLFHSNQKKHSRLTAVRTDMLPFTYIDERQFEFKPFDVIRLKKEKKKFSVVNKLGTIQFDSLVEYDTLRLARAGYRELLPVLATRSNYAVIGNKREDEFKIVISEKAKKLATYFETFGSEAEAQVKLDEIFPVILACTYRLHTSGPIPHEWEFTYRSMDLSGRAFTYVSNEHYNSEVKVRQAATYFYSHITQANIRVRKNSLSLVLGKQELRFLQEEPAEIADAAMAEEAKRILRLSQNLFRNIHEPSEEEFSAILERSRINPGEDFVYKLVDRDNLLARYTGPSIIQEEADAEKLKYDLFNMADAGYRFTEINLSGDAVHEVKDAGKETWYHYSISCTNLKYRKGDQAGKELVLFKSTKGYTSREEALAALQENYLTILKFARTEKNYGSNAFISLREIVIHSSDPNDRSKSRVFVPAETQYEYDGVDVPRRLMAIASGYPVWFLRKNKYRFVLGNIDVENAAYTMDWRSLDTWNTAQEAMFRFKFFLILLKYTGNFYIEWSPVNCRYHMYIREVLAISAHGFLTADEAWGPAGVEKFICTTQSKGGFHPYWNRVNCSNGFYIACGNTGLIHPCTYDTPERRDEAIDRLYRASGFNFPDLISQVADDQIVLNNLKNEPVARINTGNYKRFRFTACDWLMKFIESANLDDNYKKTPTGLQLIYRFREKKGEVLYPIAESVSPAITLQEWKEQLRKITCYFPVEERVILCDSVETRKYVVRIKLPGFDRCGYDLAEDPPCPTTDQGKDCDQPCHVAWESECCFDTCCDAFAFYARSLLLLSRYENYKPVYECPCGSYRIELHPQLSLKGREEFESKSRELIEKITMICRAHEDPAAGFSGRSRNLLNCSGEIVAINPQVYTNEKMACEAIDRAKRLVNSEGLHLVEHILLRPRCSNRDENPDDDCRDILKPCSSEEDTCHLKWIPGGDVDICTEGRNTCFTPGYDPYSFISTIALPAWPERFRSRENRQRIEKLLHREAPAHVLLRILWLTPQDLFRFEIYFKPWNEWLAGKICDPAYANCDFLAFLFRGRFDYLADCHECRPCPCGKDQPESCFEKNEDEPCAGFDLAGTLNELYCWVPRNTPDIQPQ